jgi:hypothetical protein
MYIRTQQGRKKKARTKSKLKQTATSLVSMSNLTLQTPKTPKHSANKEGSQKRDRSNSTSTRKDKKEKKRKSINFERPAREEDMQVDIPTEVSQKVSRY